MNDHELPDDLERWPREPFQVLGVKPGVTAKELRRAYTHLIRRFKPEHFPEHFRRIREAYDQVQFFTRFSYPQAPPVPTESPEPKTSPQPSALPTLALSPSEDDDIDALWRQACQGGQAHEVYRKMVALNARHPERGDLYPRLYWLLWTVPSVDPGQDPCHWLDRGLRQNWNGPCLELYRREIEQWPSQAVGERFGRLLECEAPLATLAGLVEWRWLAAGALGQWQVIVADIKTMRPRFAGKDDSNWVRLLLTAIDQLAWAPGVAGHVKNLIEEIDQLSHVHAFFDLSRLDVLRDLAEAWKRLNPNQYSPALLRLVARAWNRPFHEFRVPLLGVLEELLAKPEASLAMLDALHRAAPVVLGQFAMMVEQFRYQPGFSDQKRPELDKLLDQFLEETSPENYSQYRLQWLRFMLRESLRTDQVLIAVGQSARLQRYFDPNAYHRFSEDWPLRIMCLAQCAYWG